METFTKEAPAVQKPRALTFKSIDLYAPPAIEEEYRPSRPVYRDDNEAAATEPSCEATACTVAGLACCAVTFINVLMHQCALGFSLVL